MHRGTSKTVAIVYGTRLEAITAAPLIRALEGHPWLSTVVMTAGEPGAEDLDDVHDVFAIGPEAADPASGPIVHVPLADRVRQADLCVVIAADSTVEALAEVDGGPSLVVIDRGQSPLAIQGARLHLVSNAERAAELAEAGVPDESVRIVGDPATQALGELVADSAGLPNDAQAMVLEDSPRWSERQRRGYARETFLHTVLVDPQLRQLLAVAASPFHDGQVGQRCVAAIEEMLADSRSVENRRNPVAA